MGNPTRTTAPPAHAGPVSTHPRNKPLTLLVWGLIALALGYTLDLAGITPIIKRIATTSFTLASLGWVLWALAICYWWIDIRNHRNRLRFFTVVGMNSLFIYLFFEIVGDRWFNGWAGAITNGLMQPADIPVLARGIITALAIFTFEWSLCYFLFRKKIFFRL
jgi:predicted acyltransferase